MRTWNRYTSNWVVFGDIVKKSIKISGEVLTLKKGDANWIVERNVVTKQYKNPKKTSTKLTPKQAFLEEYEEHVYKSVLEKKVKQNVKCGWDCRPKKFFF